MKMFYLILKQCVSRIDVCAVSLDLKNSAACSLQSNKRSDLTAKPCLLVEAVETHF